MPPHRDKVSSIEGVLFGILIGISSSTLGLKICEITAETKIDKIDKKMINKHDKIDWLAKTKTNTIEALVLLRL